MAERPVEIPAFGKWKNNAELMLAVRQLGYLSDQRCVWDCTYGQGAFWNLWKPAKFIGTDLYTDAPDGKANFIAPVTYPMGYIDIVYDPPYKLNGRPTPEVDDPYGVGKPTRWQDRMDLIGMGTRRLGSRLPDNGYLLVKVMDMVSSGAVRWQTDLVTNAAREVGLQKVDRFDMPTGRPQPSGRRQVHARRNTSQLLVFTK